MAIRVGQTFADKTTGLTFDVGLDADGDPAVEVHNPNAKEDGRPILGAYKLKLDADALRSAAAPRFDASTKFIQALASVSAEK